MTVSSTSRLQQARQYRASTGSLVSKEVKDEIAKKYGEISQLEKDLSLLQATTDRDQSIATHQKAVIKAQDRSAFEEAKAIILNEIYKLDPNEAKGTSEKLLEGAAIGIGKAQAAAVKGGAMAGIVASPVKGLFDGFKAGMKTNMPERRVPEFHVA